MYGEWLSTFINMLSHLLSPWLEVGDRLEKRCIVVCKGMGMMIDVANYGVQNVVGARLMLRHKSDKNMGSILSISFAHDKFIFE